MAIPSRSPWASSTYCYPVVPGNVSLDFTGHSLILPVVSHACVPQLAVDLLINSSSLGLRKVARLAATKDLIPFVGADEGGKGGITTALEVYSNASSKLTVIQQRSPVLKARRHAFSRRFTSWIRAQGFAEVVILSSIDNALRTEVEMNSEHNTFCFVPTASASASTSTSMLRRLIEVVPELGRTAIQVKDENVPIPSSSTGLTRRLLSDLTRPCPEGDTALRISRPISTGVLLLFAAEGDNRPDAHFLAEKTADLYLAGDEGKTRACVKTFTEPPSWAGLFGSGFDQALFG